MTLLLTRSEVEQVLDARLLAEQLRTAFIAYSTGDAPRARRVRADLAPNPGSATVLFPGMLPGLPVYTVKVHAKFPAQAPAIRGLLCLHEASTGELLAVMDSTYLTAMRTGISGALAAHILARPEADTVAIVGAGVQGVFQLRALARMRPLRRVWVHDLRSDRSDAFTREMSREFGLNVTASSSAAESVRDAEIILTATWSRTPFLDLAMLRPGAHVTSLGPDEPGKAEVAGDLIRAGLFICDDRFLAVELGALAGVGLGPEAVAAELGEVLAGRHPGRTSREQITVYGGVGLAFQDAVAAWQIYQNAQHLGLGQRLNFLG